LEVAEKNRKIEEVFKKQDLSEMTKSAPAGSSIVTITCAGDLLAVDALLSNTDRLFEDIAPFYKNDVDIVSANLESTVYAQEEPGRKVNPGRPAQMNTSEAMLDKFCKDAGINFFSTATNHALDWGSEGAHATLDMLKKYNAKYGINYSGTAATQNEQDEVLILEINGVKIALLSFTMDLNDYPVPKDEPFLVNELRFNDVNPLPNYALIRRQVSEARFKGADWIIAYCHWGWEFEMYPHTNIRVAASTLIDLGIDTILGNHAHVSQPSELVPRSGKQDALVVYSFGDFVSHHPDSRNSKLSYIIKFQVFKSGSGTAIQLGLSGLKAMPVYIVNQHLGGDNYNCRIIQFDKVLNDRDGYGLTEIEKSQLNHLRDKVWGEILSPLSKLPKS
jgi:poly-gamma-glutamate capsule biosynthesis protein CapA/YwtB (metallophosphatase superfamily)